MKITKAFEKIKSPKQKVTKNEKSKLYSILQKSASQGKKATQVNVNKS